MPIYKRGGIYWFHFYFKKRHIQRSTRQGNAALARQMEAAELTKLAKGEFGIHDPKPSPTFGQAMRDFLQWSAQEHKTHPGTYRRYLTSSAALRRYFGEKLLDRITPDDVERFKIKRAAQKSDKTKRLLRPASVNRELACLKALFNFAIKGDLVVRNPVKGVKFLDENNEQTRVLSYREQRSYLEAAAQPLRDIAVVMLETGMRPDEVHRIERANVNLVLGFLFNPHGKTKAAKRKISLTSVAAEVVERRLRLSAGRYLFPCQGDADRPIPKVNNAHSRAVRASGVRPFRLYDLRHTWATRAAMSGIDLVTLAAMLGHARIQMVLRYAHPTQEHQTQAAQRLEKFNAAQQLAEYERKSEKPLQFPLQ